MVQNCVAQIPEHLQQQQAVEGGPDVTTTLPRQSSYCAGSTISSVSEWTRWTTSSLARSPISSIFRPCPPAYLSPSLPAPRQAGLRHERLLFSRSVLPSVRMTRSFAQHPSSPTPSSTSLHYSFSTLWIQNPSTMPPFPRYIANSQRPHLHLEAASFCASCDARPFPISRASHLAMERLPCLSSTQHSARSAES